MARKATLIDSLMNECAVYGGLVLRRCDILALAREHLGEHAGEPFGAQYFAFHGPAVIGLEPWPLEEARRVMQ